MIEFKLPKETLMGGWFIDDKICDAMIQSYENNTDNTSRGKYGNKDSDNHEVDLDYKDSYDLKLYSDVLLHPYVDYMKELSKCMDAYIQKFEHVKYSAPFRILEVYNLQKYLPGGGFKAWHFEEGGVSDRLLVFMTYLNDVEDGGTEFKYQNLTTPAKKGLTLIWPVYWTHTHRGQVSNTKTKYITTGWFDFYE